MNTLLTKLIKAEVITDSDLAEELYDICDSVHAGCSEDCPIYELILTDKQKNVDCPFFKDGKKMLNALKKHYSTKLTGTKFCHDCSKFYSGDKGMFCQLSKFDGQYTEKCPRKIIN